uniref:Ig-like domain-containing protein n=1 Tax=Pygocentrus nattereri TaxID=42514 RepID=A0AAR2IUF4_PYGNA
MKITLHSSDRFTLTEVENAERFLIKGQISSQTEGSQGVPGRIQIVLEHAEVTLECNILSSGQQSVEWMLPDLTTLEKSDSHRLVSEHNRLIIKNTSLSDSGLYHCFVRTNTDVDIVAYRLTVRERLLSPSDLNGKKMNVENGESLSLPCLVTSSQPIETRWFLPKHESLKASNKKGRIYVSQNNTLVIQNVMHEDAGEYSCLAANLHGADMLSHLVVVTGEKEEDPSDVSEVLDRTISLFPNGTLSIYTANFSSKGDYKCIASNAAGADTLTYHLHVALLPPTIKEEASESISINIDTVDSACAFFIDPRKIVKRKFYAVTLVT